MFSKLLSYCLLCTVLYGYQLKAQSPELQVPDIAQLRNHIYAGIEPELKPEHFSTESWERKTYRFADITARQIGDIIRSGAVYTDRPGMEKYLNAIMQKVQPAELLNDSIVHVYVVADGSHNAFMTPSGSMFINIGLLAECNSEAAIASVMAHELAHYQQRHSVLSFIKAETGEFRDGLFRNNSASHFSIKNEYESDSLAMIWLSEAGYDLNGMLHSFQDIFQINANRLRRIENKFEQEETSHPLSHKRLEKLIAFMQSEKDREGKEFLVSEEYFYNHISTARVETLRQLLRGFRYADCIEKAFKFHLFDPNNQEYLYYLLEGIRRRCYMDATKWNKNFITDRYYVAQEVDNWKVKEEMTDHLFVQFKPDLLMIHPAEINDIKAKFYWEEQPKFTTYEQAFVFYYRVGRAINNNEVILSNALSVVNDTAVRANLLREYLTKDKIRHRDYAENLLNGTIYTKLNNRKLTALSSFDAAIKHGDEAVFLPYNADIAKNYIRKAINPDPKREFVYMDSIFKTNISDYRVLKRLENFSQISVISTGNKAEVHILEPEWWQIFERYGVNEIEFVQCLYVESKKTGKTKEEYEHLLKINGSDLFNTIKTPRNFMVGISSVRNIKNARMKFRYYEDNSLKSREPATTQIVECLSRNLEEMDKWSLHADNKYRFHQGEIE